MTEREQATILAALRSWQNTENAHELPEWDIATDEGMKALDSAEIDSLCERLNTGGADYYERSQLDDQDREILSERAAARAARSGKRPLVGDFAMYPNGDLRRFTEEWGEAGIQVSVHGCLGSFYLTESGLMSYSGGLDPIIPYDRIAPSLVAPDSQATREGACWFFHHGHAGPGRGVETTVPCLVWRVYP